MPEEVDGPGGVLRAAGDENAFRLGARILEIAPVPVAYVSAGLVVLQCNAAAARQLGGPADRLLGRRLEDLVGRDSPLLAAAAAAVHTLQPVTHLLPGDAGGGGAVVSVTCTPDIDARGRLLGLIVTMSESGSRRLEEGAGESAAFARRLAGELAEARELQRGLRRELELLRTVVKHSADGIVVARVDGRAVLCNPAMRRIAGRDLAGIGEKDWLEVAFTDSRERDRAASVLRRALLGESAAEEIPLTREDGERRMLRLSASPFRLDGNDLVLAVASDVTERDEAERELGESESLFRTIFELSSAGIGQLDAEGRFLKVNRSLAEMLGYAPQQLERMSFSEVTHPDDLEADLREIGTLLSGEADRCVMEKRFVRADGGEVWTLVAVAGVRDAEGGVEYLVGVAQDIGERKRGEELALAMHRIDAALHSTLEFGDTVQRVVVEAVDALGVETGRVALLEEGRWATRYGHRLPAGTEAVSYTDEEAPHFALAARERAVIAVDDALSDARLDRGAMERLGECSSLVVPLVSRDEVIGVMSFSYHDRTIRFTPAEVSFADRIASSVTLALENARLYDAQHRVADTLQDAIIRMPERMPGLDFCSLYGSATEASRVGGDFMDLFELAGGRVGVLIGDVSGKGVDAAALTSLVKNVVRAYAHEDASPARVMERLNRAVDRETAHDMFVTVFLGVLDPRSGWLAYCSGGHPPAMVRRRGGRLDLLGAVSPIVGALPDSAYAESFEHVGEGDVLLLYTDGAIEARRPDGEMFGEERLGQALLSADLGAGMEEVCRSLFAAVSAFASGRLADDLALLPLALDPSGLPSASHGGRAR
ncbi:MAG: SpoIIE family protein phosphatase [Coriobacteriia bacterium]|nr:SpoIIE family protein phosphatase [Coriobacteriia bacterium]